MARALAFPAPPRTVRLDGAEERLAGAAGEALLVGLAGIDRPAGVLLLCQPADGDRLIAEYVDRCGLALTAAQMYAEQSSIVDFLAAALYGDDDALFTDFLGWLATVLDSRHVPPASVDVGLATYDGALDGFPRARRALAAGRRTLAAWPHDVPGGPHPPHGDAAGSGGGER